MTYKELTQILQNNHFYPKEEVTVGKSGKTLTGLRIEPRAIMFEETADQIKKALGPYDLKITAFRKQGYVSIKIP